MSSFAIGLPTALHRLCGAADPHLIFPESPISFARTPEEARIFASWVGRRSVTWIGVGRDLARRSDPDLEDAVFLRIDRELYSIQHVVDGDPGDLTSHAISVRRWGRAESRGQAGGGAVSEARIRSRQRWAARCEISVDPEGNLCIEQSSRFHRGFKTWGIGLLVFIDDGIGRNLLTLYPSRDDQAVVLSARLAKPNLGTTRGERLILASREIERWNVEQIYVDDRSILFDSVPASMFSPESLDAIVDLRTTSFTEFRVVLSASPTGKDPAEIVGALLATTAGERRRHLMGDLGIREFDWDLPERAGSGLPGDDDRAERDRE